jgi:hypothetical protein
MMPTSSAGRIGEAHLGGDRRASLAALGEDADVLATGWGVGDERLDLLLGILGHALDFQTWRSLVRQQGLSDERAVEAMAGMVRCLTRG